MTDEKMVEIGAAAMRPALFASPDDCEAITSAKDSVRADMRAALAALEASGIPLSRLASGEARTDAEAAEVDAFVEHVARGMYSGTVNELLTPYDDMPEETKEAAYGMAWRALHSTGIPLLALARYSRAMIAKGNSDTGAG